MAQSAQRDVAGLQDELSATAPIAAREIQAPVFATDQQLRLQRQAYLTLRAGFTLAPIVAGLDKFSNRLVNWEQYIAPQIPKRLGVSPRRFMQAVGVIEMSAGIGVALRPQIFSYVVSAWLGGIIGNLILGRRNYDIALRDLGLSLGALALGRLSQAERAAASVRGEANSQLAA